MDHASENQDKNLERRREQNRLAQRRFRERHNNQTKAAAFSAVTLINSETLPHGGLSPTEPMPLGFLNATESMDMYIDNVLLSNADPTSRVISRVNSGPDTAEDATDQQLQEHLMKESSIVGEFSPSYAPPDLVYRTGQLRGEIEEQCTEESGWLSPLHIAATKGNDKIVQLLIQHNSNSNEKDSDGVTPLMRAVEGGFEEVVWSLLRHGAHVDEKDARGQSSLHLAVIHRHEAILQQLLENCHGLGSAVNSYNVNGRTPLHIAIEIGFDEGVRLLLRYGANVSLRARKISISAKT
ncbi:uncharacterized protein TRUGW13939_09503 [Talaromyces rugulosus]|uniref:BZIP domain-containing protein n=1 Tax=Talaromyces rugulosus TaxID=121627 RepID=A0A7H8R7H9_TALRU|nr:uncharacterized protein TRUGW13939_09503 [Talaromyces rugulosus]QKX62344.1 hypothetical protein TRUGW13939_09503 [Talaromyces rugulosus]